MDALRQLSPADDPLLGAAARVAAAQGGPRRRRRQDLHAAGHRPTRWRRWGCSASSSRSRPRPTRPSTPPARLLQAHPDHLTGAFLIDGLSSQRVRLTPRPGGGGAQGPARQVPAGPGPQRNAAGRLYTVHVEPVQTGRHYGQALLARVTLSNFGIADLTVGGRRVHPPGHAVRGRAGVQPSRPRRAAARRCSRPSTNGAGRVVLHPRESLTQVVRVDQAPLLAELDRTAPLMFGIDGRMTTNSDTHLGRPGHAVHQPVRPGQRQPGRGGRLPSSC